MPGTPESGLAGSSYDRAASASGVRWISVDKPGYGHSDPLRRRSLLGWPDDIAELSAHLGLERFAVAGESGGGPHALAVSRAFPERVTVTALLASMGPSHEPWVRQGMRPTNVVFFYLASYLPMALRVPLSVMRCALRIPAIDARIESSGPAADQAAARDPEAGYRDQAVEDAFRGGTRAAAEELQLFAKPWGFDLAEVTGPVQLWHGTSDVNVPISIALGLASQLPEVVTHYVENAGHCVGFDRRHEVMRVVIGAAAGGHRGECAGDTG